MQTQKQYRTPWGMSDNIEPICEGIEFVSTPSHGGYRLSDKRLKEMCPTLRNLGEGRYFEEDCAYVAVILSFSGMMGMEIERWNDALKTLRNWYPDEYMEYTGESINAGESYILDKRNFDKDNFDKFVGTAAVSVNDKFVKVWLKKESTGEKEIIYVTTEEYRSRGRNSYVPGKPWNL